MIFWIIIIDDLHFAQGVGHSILLQDRQFFLPSVLIACTKVVGLK